MATILGPGYSVEWDGKPPQITAQEWEILLAFKVLHENDIKRIFYNVRVGGGSSVPPDIEPESALYWVTSTMLRIDAVVETDTEVWILELRPRLTKSIIGSLHIYLALWNASPPIDKPARAIAVVDEGSHTIEAFCALNNYEVIII